MDAITVYRSDFPRLYQTDDAFASVPQIRHGGCFFISIVMALALNFKLIVTHADVLNFYAKELANGKPDVDNEMFIGSAQNLIDDFVGPGKVVYKGAEDTMYHCGPREIEWGCWHRLGTNFNHFTHNANGQCISDPWRNPDGSGSESVKDGKLIGKRIALIIV